MVLGFWAFNKGTSPLAKWIRWFHLEKGALWRRVIVFKFGSTQFDLKPASKTLHLIQSLVDPSIL